MDDDKGKGDSDYRQDFLVGWSGDANNAFSASGRTEMQKQYFDFSKKLFNWRKSKSVIHNGKLKHYIPENNVYIYFRYNDNESVMVVMNNAAEAQKINLSRFKESLQEYSSGFDIISGTSLELKNELNIEGKSSMIIELKK